MNKLLLMLITVTGIVSLYGMDVGSYYYMHPPRPRSPWQSTGTRYGVMSTSK